MCAEKRGLLGERGKRCEQSPAPKASPDIGVSCFGLGWLVRMLKDRPRRLRTRRIPKIGRSSYEFHETGGPEVLRWEDVEVGEPGEGQARIRHTAVGVNFIDTYHRSGLYPLPLPSGLGSEAAGVVEAVGPGVTVVSPGDRVAYAGGPPGSYSEARLLPAGILVPIPEGVTDQTAAAVMLKGMTSQYLIRRTYPVKAGETVLFHAAAGGVGLIACQWLKALGATVIGTVGFGREGGGGPGPRLRPRASSRRERTSRSVSARSPAGRASRWSTTRSARTRSWRPSTA